MVAKFLFALACLVFAVSLEMFRRAFGAESPWLALQAMFVFLGLARFASPFYLFKLPRMLQTLRPWEGSSKSPIWGVHAFGRLLRDTPLRYLNPVVYLTRGRLAGVEKRVESAEAIHWWAAALIMPYIVYAAIRGWWSVVAWFVLLQVLGNLYPILHLRLVRGRLQRFLEKKGSP